MATARNKAPVMFRFTIRDVLWLMAVVAMGLGWWADRRWLTGDDLAFRAQSMELVLRREGWSVEQSGPSIRISIPGGNEYEWGPPMPQP
jgi:hypothetical protein